MGLFSGIIDSLFGTKAPDNSGINDSARESAAIAREQFDWFKQEYAKTTPDREKQTALANKVSESQIAGMQFATDEAKRLSMRNQQVFQPLEDKIVADAQAYDTPARRAQASNEARADVEAAYGRAQAGNTRALMRMSSSAPTGTAATALMQDAALSKAKAVSGATTMATRNVEQQGYARMQDAAAIGKGLIGNQGTQQQIASNTGGAAVNSGNAALGAATSGAGLMQVGGSQALQGIGQAGSLYGQAAGIESATRGQNIDLLKTGIAAMSDKNVKKGTGKVTDGKSELDEINAVPVEKDWQYDESKGAPAGSEGTPRTGPMAQNVRAKMGEDVAPGGKQIDLVSMNGKTMAAVQQLSKQVTGLERRIARMSNTDTRKAA